MQWNHENKLTELQSLFALNGLRDGQAHAPSKEREMKIAAACEVFGIDGTAMVTGWGYAIDAVYDQLSSDLSAIAQLIEDVE